MLVSLENRVAVITGASQGLGLAMARQFAESGAQVALIARRESVLNEAVNEVQALTDQQIKGYTCDVTDLAAVDATFSAIEKDFGQVDIVVNNAGASARHPTETLDMSVLQADFDLKVKPALRLVQLAVPGMKLRRWGRIINVVNIGAKAPGEGTAPTSMNRAAGIAMTKVMSKEYAPHNILVNALCVGQIMSEQWRGYHKRDHPEMSFDEFVAMRGKPLPLGRIGEAREFAYAACFLASDRASFISGVALNVDGGQSPVL